MYTLPIKKIRNQKHMTLEQLSEITGISVSQLSRLEADNLVRSRSTTLVTLEKIALGLSVCPKDLLYYDCETCQLKNNCKKEKVDINDLMEENLQFYI